MIWRETLGTTNSAFYTRFAKGRAQLHSTFDVRVKDRVVEIVEGELKILWNVMKQYWVVFIATHRDCLSCNIFMVKV